MTKVASITTIYGPYFFLKWLNELPIKLTEKQIEKLIEQAELSKTVLWTKHGGFRFY